MSATSRGRRMGTKASEMTWSKEEYLMLGGTMFAPDKVPFSNEKEAAECWRFNRETLMARTSEQQTFEPNFLPGCRPFGFWKYDLRMDPPDHEARELMKRGLLDPIEREAVCRLARQQWEKLHRSWRPELSHEWVDYPDDELLNYWPGWPPDKYELDEAP
jgi:hypothetical protein